MGRLLACLIVVLSLAGCAIPVGLPLALSAAGGIVSLAKEVLELDVAWHQSTPGKTPIMGAEGAARP